MALGILYTLKITEDVGVTVASFSHSIPEIMAISISLYLSTWSLRAITNKILNKRLFLNESLKEFGFLGFLGLSLVIISAFIEANISQNVVNSFCK